MLTVLVYVFALCLAGIQHWASRWFLSPLWMASVVVLSGSGLEALAQLSVVVERASWGGLQLNLSPPFGASSTASACLAVALCIFYVFLHLRSEASARPGWLVISAAILLVGGWAVATHLGRLESAKLLVEVTNGTHPLGTYAARARALGGVHGTTCLAAGALGSLVPISTAAWRLVSARRAEREEGVGA